MRITHYPALDEALYTQVLPNGLQIAVVKKPGFFKKCAYLAVNYGSIDTRYSLGGEVHVSPDGVAHYLEHKMFDLPGRDVSAEFAELGANPNAFTAYSMTAYYFTCTLHFDRCLRLLLEFVSTPYFTKESVEKERGIIGQEIRMYEDNADSKVYEDLFSAMYRKHPVRVPIAGSEESIGNITAQTLYDCYRAFYHPGNMILTVVGDVDPEEVVRIARDFFPDGPGEMPVRDYGEAEAMVCRGRDSSRVMDVAMPTFQLGFKCPWPGKGPACVHQQIIGDLVAEALMGESSRLYLRLYREGLIDGSFAAGYEDLPGVALLSCGGDSRNPEAVRQAIWEEAERISREGIDEALFLRLKKSALGRRFRSLDSFDSLCFRICAAHFDEVQYLDFPAQYEAVTREQVEQFLRQTVGRDNCAMSVVLPR